MTPLADWERRLVAELSLPLPLDPRPFRVIAERIGLDEEQVIERVRAWQESGVIRRFGARVNHRSLGYAANGMSVWDAPDERVDEAARHMAERPEVSHCYLRARQPGWPYNLYAMIHGGSRDEVDAVAAQIASVTGLTAYRVLYSSREFKKSTPRYFQELASGDRP
jgi:DNA-binding Lrp family transcriptional regulator